MMTILYEVGNKLYLNITNRCPCSCTFCIRNNGDGAYGSDSLWLEREPTVQEVIEQLEKTDLNNAKQAVNELTNSERIKEIANKAGLSINNDSIKSVR